MNWLYISLLLCSFGFFRELRPSEPFAVEFLTGEWRNNVTAEQVNKEVYPFGTYSYLVQLVIVFLVTDIARYKPIIVLSALAGIGMWALMLWTTTLWALQFVQTLYGMYMSAEVAYYTYIYTKVDREKYQQVTGHTRAAILLGKFLGALLGQIFISYNVMDLRGLNYISFGTQVLSLLIAVSLPAVDVSLYFYTKPEFIVERETTISIPRENSITCIEVNAEPEPRLSIAAVKAPQTRFSWRNASALFVRHITDAYTNPIVIQWSLWWAMATCGYLLGASYIQFLWKEIDPEHENFYNGGVEAVLTLLSALGAFCAGFYKHEKYQKWDLVFLTVLSLCEAACLVLAGTTQTVWVAYAMYILFGVVYFFVITVASGVVAQHLIEDSFGLIFGINTLAALLLQTILTLAVVSDTGLGLAPREQYLTFGGYFILLAVVFGVVAVVSNSRKCCKILFK